MTENESFTFEFSENNEGNIFFNWTVKAPDKITALKELKASLALLAQRKDKIEILLKSKVLEQKNATIALDFDPAGNLTKIRREDVLYKEGKTVL